MDEREEKSMSDPEGISNVTLIDARVTKNGDELVDVAEAVEVTLRVVEREVVDVAVDDLVGVDVSEVGLRRLMKANFAVSTVRQSFKVNE